MLSSLCGCDVHRKVRAPQSLETCAFTLMSGVIGSVPECVVRIVDPMAAPPTVWPRRTGCTSSRWAVSVIRLQVAPESIITVSAGRPKALRGAVQFGAVLAAIVGRAIRALRAKTDTKAALAPC